MLGPEEARQLLDSIDTCTPIGLRDRTLIGLMVYSFERIGAALGMTVDDVYTQDRRLWVRLHEKGGKRHEMPWHHKLEGFLHAYIEGCGLADDHKGPLFRTAAGSLRSSLRRMAAAATPTSAAGHAHGGVQADHELTSNPDHPMGADHSSAVTRR